MIYSCASHVGKVRKNNEDYCMGEVIKVNEEETLGIFALADGMGGHKKGEVASEIAVKNILAYLKENLLQHNSIKIDYVDDIIKQAYNNVNSIIYNQSLKQEEYRGMGTTLVIAILYKEDLYVANVGDSRCYMLSNNYLNRISVDHSVVEELVRANIITEEEAIHHPHRNRITRAIGTDEMVVVDIFNKKISENDVVLLASDGLTGCVYEEDIKNILQQNKSISEINDDLINIANDISGRDNVSVVLIKA